MKLWEVLKALEENPKKEFDITLDNGYFHFVVSSCGVNDDYFNIKCFMQGNPVQHPYNLVYFYGNVSMLNDGWEKVKQPTTWQEAFEAWANDKKTIICEIDGKTTRYAGYNNVLSPVPNNVPVRRGEMRFGTWYIED